MKLILKGEDVKRFKNPFSENYIIYPHYLDNEKTKAYEEEEFKDKFPLAYDYLARFKSELIEKKIKYKNNPKHWYSLHRQRNIQLFEQPKIITSQISLGCNMFLDFNKSYHNTKCYSLVKSKDFLEDYRYFLCILNSNILWFFIKNTGDVLRGGYYSFTTEYLEPFPIPKLELLDMQKPFIEKADLIMSLTNQLQESKDNFIEWLIFNFKLEKHKNKFENIHKISKTQFFDQLRELKIDLSDINLFGSLSKNYQNITDIYTQILTNENELNHKVYKLYDLTPEEIEIIENDIKR